MLVEQAAEQDPVTIAGFKEALRKLVWSQARFARKVGVTAGTVSRWCLHTGVPRWADEYARLAVRFKRMSDVLGRLD